MPVDNQLKWMEMRDFTAGKWGAQGQLMPPNAAQVMTDCYPVAAGGLRAWFKASSFTTAGVVDTTNESPRAVFVHQFLPNRSGVGTGNDYYLVTYNSVDTKCRIYRMDQTAAGPPVVWSLIKTTVAGLDPGLVRTCDYVLTDGTRYVVFGFGAGCGTDNGIWLVKYSDGTLNHLSAQQEILVANYQSRLIAAGSVANGDPNVIKFTDAGTLANYSTNKSPVDVSEGTAITGLATFSPGDLLVLKGQGPIYLVEGDLNNYTVRQMNGSKPGGALPVRGPQGIIFLVNTDGVYETPDGGFLTPLSKQINSGNFSTSSAMVFVNHWLFYFRAGGQILDYDTKAWFDTTAMAASGYGVRLGQGWFYSDATSPFTLWTVAAVDNSTTDRAESYTFKSAPLRDPTGRQVEIRAVQVIGRSYNGATSTFTCTVNGVSRTIACDSSGRGAVTFYFMARREELDVQVVAASNAAGVQAPDIEAIRVGAQGGHFLTTGADAG